MKKTEEQKNVFKWMQYNFEDYDGPTQLAEAAADEFDHDEWLDDDTHWVWDLALEFYDI